MRCIDRDLRSDDLDVTLLLLPRADNPERWHVTTHLHMTRVGVCRLKERSQRQENARDLCGNE